MWIVLKAHLACMDASALYLTKISIFFTMRTQAQRFASLVHISNTDEHVTLPPALADP